MLQKRECWLLNSVPWKGHWCQIRIHQIPLLTFVSTRLQSWKSQSLAGQTCRWDWASKKGETSPSSVTYNFLEWGRPELRDGRNLTLSQFGSIENILCAKHNGWIFVIIWKVTGQAMRCSGGFIQEQSSTTWEIYYSDMGWHWERTMLLCVSPFSSFSLCTEPVLY